MGYPHISYPETNISKGEQILRDSIFGD